MLAVVYTNSFKKDFKKILKQQKKLEKLGSIIKTLSLEEKLDMKYKDHQLIGNFKYKRECHIEPDLLLIYEINQDEKELVLHRIGSHSELFNK